MSFLSNVLYYGTKLSGIKKMYSLPEDKFLKKVADMNKSRGFYMPNDKKAIYQEKIILNQYQCLVVQNKVSVSERAILFFFGGGMMLGPDKGDYSGVSDIYFSYSEDEVLYGAKDNFVDACEKYHVKYQIKSRKNMIHCYAMLPYFKEAKEDFEEIAEFLRK